MKSLSQAPRHRGLRRVIHRAARWLWIPLKVYLVVLLAMMFLERSLIFFPTAGGDWDPRGLEHEDARFEAADGVKLHGWYVPHPSPRATVLYAHGNAGNITHRAHIVRYFREHFDVSVMLFDYRGYGRSEGSPDEEGLLLDARAARAWLAERAGVAEEDIVLMGRSLGAAVVVDLAARDGARGLILESAFTSLPDVAAYHYPWLPVRWMMRTRLNSLSRIGDYPGPLLMSHGESDRVIPYELGRRLFEAAPDPQKKFITIPGADHNDPQSHEYHQALDAFLDRL